MVGCYAVTLCEQMAGQDTRDSKDVSIRLLLRYSERRFGTSCPRSRISRNSTMAGALRSGWESQTEAMSISLEWTMEPSWYDLSDERLKASDGANER